MDNEKTVMDNDERSECELNYEDESNARGIATLKQQSRWLTVLIWTPTGYPWRKLVATYTVDCSTLDEAIIAAIEAAQSTGKYAAELEEFEYQVVGQAAGLALMAE